MAFATLPRPSWGGDGFGPRARTWLTVNRRLIDQDAEGQNAYASRPLHRPFARQATVYQGNVSTAQPSCSAMPPVSTRRA